MSEPPEGEVTQLLREWNSGQPEAMDQLFELVYRELRKMAARYLRKERSDHTLQATALVNEAYVRLVGQRKAEWQDRAHFFAIAAQVMRRILVDHARRQHAGKRISSANKISLDQAPELSHEPSMDLLGIDEALGRLEQLDPRQARVVELRFFGGLTVPEVAQVLEVSEATVAREWRAARVWLYRELQGGVLGES